MKLSYRPSFLFVITFFFQLLLFSQPNTSIDLEKKKPEKYKDKLLSSEKTDDQKLGAIKRFFNNTYTHYNYYYNATVKFNEIIEKAKSVFTDDYTTLLPFYNYNLNTTATDKNIDSLIYKCNAGILLHDLRSDWVDDMYMLLGKAYFLRKDFDSAHHVFQYLNYVYAPKDDGYDIPIGSNASNQDGVFSIATNEKKRPFIQKLIRKPLERNEAFLWMIRNKLEQTKIGEADALISILRVDPNFPKRLKDDLRELTAYSFYLQKNYDSAAYHLEKSLSNTENKTEKARWEFLCGQMYQLAKKQSKAELMFEKAIKHSTNPLVEVYANLYLLNQFNDTGKQSLSKYNNVEALEKLAKKERFYNYRDIIYYAAGNISLQQKNTNKAAEFYLKSSTTSTDNATQKNKSFLALADLNYTIKKYKPAYVYYDSINIKFIDSADLFRINSRKPALRIISKNIDAVHLQDSLQVLAKLPPKELNDILKKIFNKYKKDKGLKDELNSFDFGNDNPLAATNSAIYNSIDLKPGEFYFDNAALKSQGIKEFKARWGNRPNVDDWNRAAAINSNLNSDKQATESQTKSKRNVQLKDANVLGVSIPDMDDPSNTIDKNSKSQSPKAEAEIEVEITPEYLYNAIPLTEEKIDASNKIIINALYQNGKTFSDVLDDCATAIITYEDLLMRFPDNEFTEKAMFNLAYCYKNTNKIQKGKIILEALDLDFGNGTQNKIAKAKTANPEKTEATKVYSNIYKLFNNENYEQAVKEKNITDSIFKGKYWNPQLNLIEAIYLIKQQNDSAAVNKLNTIINNDADKQLKEKAATMIDVLKRRKAIIAHLNTLDSTGKFDSSIIFRERYIKDSLIQAAKDAYVIDSSLIGKSFVNNPLESHFSLLLLNEVENAFINQTKTSIDSFNLSNSTTKAVSIQALKLNKQYTLILLGPHKDASIAIFYIDYLKQNMQKVLPWLPSSKFSFSIIGVSNLEILKANNNMDKYKAFIKSTFPDKF